MHLNHQRTVSHPLEIHSQLSAHGANEPQRQRLHDLQERSSSHYRNRLTLLKKNARNVWH